MYWRGLLLSVVREVRVHRSRSTITILGIVVGISAVTILLSVGNLARQYVQFELESLAGVKGARVLGASDPGGTAAPIHTDEFSMLLKRVQDYDAVQASPVMRVPQTLVTLGGSRVVVAATGVSDEFFSIRRVELRGGRLIRAADVSRQRAVCVIDEVALRLLQRFGIDPSRGISLAGRHQDRLAVVGVVRDGSESEPDVYLPWTRMSDGVVTRPAVRTSLLIRGEPAIYSEMVSESLIESFSAVSSGRRLSAAPPPEANLRAADRVLSGIRAFLAAVAGISLVVGGLGIANVMFMSIGERTREIGIRRSFGATSRDIRRLFLGESMFLTIVGGVLGAWIGLVVLSSVGGVLRIRGLPIGVNYAFVARDVWIVLWLSAVTGLLAGYRPASRAAAVPVVEALRTE